MIKLIVNLITTFRFLFSLTIPFMQDNISEFIITFVIILLFITDFIDGFLARKFKVQTLYGSMLDTIADKTLSIILILLLVEENKLLIFVLLLEILISLINIYATVTGKKVSSSIIGKIKTWFIATTIIISYINKYNIINYLLIKFSTWITIILQILTLPGYVKNIILQAKNKNNIYSIKSIYDLKKVLFDTEYYNKLNEIKVNKNKEIY